MTEQLEDDFWAQERARAAAERGRHADPSACGTCRTAVEAGGQVQHDECAQRATLLQAPDQPYDELILDMTEEEVHALPARFHIPASIEPTKSWVCAVCWGDGWSTQWPCKTAVDHGLRVFTPEHEAETAAKRQAAELAAYRALDLCDLDGRVSAACGNPEHPTWLRKPDDTRGCPWCRVAELETERKKYVGAEPTIAEEMAYLSSCFHAVHDLCDQATAEGITSGGMFTVDAVRAAASGERPENPNDNRRRIYLDAKGNGWISASSDDGTEYVIPVQPAAFVEQAVEDVAEETGGLREIGRCW